MLMKSLLSFFILGLALSGTAQSQGIWRDETGKPVKESESMKSSAGFGGSLLVTTDENWKEKWDTPPETKPEFKKADVVPYGKKVFVLVFFANPMRDGSGNANLRCDLSIIDPNGKRSLDQRDASCFSGRIAGSPYNVYLSNAVIAFSGDPGDPSGIWVVEVKLRDTLRNVELPLRTSFQLKQ